jgi:adenosylmethionine-8-amino-7-oxononanoate aminotransferase
MRNEYSKVWYRQLDGDIPLMRAGVGWYLQTNSGSHVLDMSGGPCFSSLGHSNRYVIEAIISQVGRLPNAFSGFWASEAAERAGDIIAGIFEEDEPNWFGRVIFQNGGGEAVDLACKLAAQYHAEAGSYRNLFVSRELSFHGVGLLPFALSGSYPRYRMMDEYHSRARSGHVVHAAHPFIDGSARSISSIKSLLADDCKNIAAVIIEPVSGPPVGAWADTRQYLQELRLLCDQYGVLLIFDEILCGSGRCGALSVSKIFNVWPDIVLLGKGLTSGYQPMSAICVSRKVVDRIASGSKKLMFGTTYSAHTTGCAAVAATLEYMQHEQLFQRVRDGGEELRSLINAGLCDTPAEIVGGCGYLWGIKLPDPATGKYLDPSREFHATVRRKIFDKGAVVYSKGQTVRGQGDFLTIAPPFETPINDLKYGVECIRKGIVDAYG